MLITVLHERNHSLLIFITGPSMEKKNPTPKPKQKTQNPQNQKQTHTHPPECQINKKTPSE